MDTVVVSAVVIAAIVLVALVVAVAVKIRYKIASPSEALIIVGRKGRPVTNPQTGEVTTDLSGQKVVMGAGVFVKPLVQQAHRLSLSSVRIPISIRGAVSRQGIRLNVDGVAIVKVGGTEDFVRAAAQRFLQQQKEIEPFTQEVLAGSLRGVIGTLTVEEIIRDRVAFARQVEEEAVTSLNNQGLVLDTLQIQDVSDDGNYLKDLGRPEAANARRAAEIAEANNAQEAQQAKSLSDAKIAQAQRDLALQQAQFRADQDKAAAEADAAGRLAEAAAQQQVLQEQERVAQRQAELTERTLDTEVRKPADARRYQAEQEAMAHKTARVLSAEAEQQAAVATAQADAERVRLSAQADATRVQLAAEAELQRRTADANAVRLEGQAQAEALTLTGAAKAEALSKEAQALKEFGQAALTQRALEVLPQVAQALASPIAGIKDLTVISNDGAGALSRSVGSNLQETFEVLKRTTGVDVTELLRSVGAGHGSARSGVGRGGQEVSDPARARLDGTAPQG
ncbi:flotillin family protein [Kineococcus rhizosphaerae]|uniref:Flotillin n=1 Tax=Kineococcus rhizosphaerae TaxID=559628 RepID=A0A2T0QZC8_9ACTN|nr:flotillin family protein [Kineococcus rhizosphaerae]PRY12049.1 flotillin [Kineococcus rhizosphaerae]